MKRIGLFLIPILIFSCEFNITKKKDLLEEISYTESGLVSDDVYTLINDLKEKRNQFVFGEKIEVVFNSVTGFNRIEGVAFPKIKILILTEDEKDTINYVENVLSDLKDGSTEDPLQLKAFLTNTLPINNYVLHLTGSDIKGDGFFNFSMPFEVIKNERISVVEYGLKANVVYLFDETKQKGVTDNFVDINSKISLIINGIEGFDKNDSIIFPEFSLNLKDVNGNLVINEENLFEEYLESGVGRTVVERQISAFINFTPGEIRNPYKLKAIFREKKSGKKIDVVTFLNIKS